MGSSDRLQAAGAGAPPEVLTAGRGPGGPGQASGPAPGEGPAPGAAAAGLRGLLVARRLPIVAAAAFLAFRLLDLLLFAIVVGQHRSGRAHAGSVGSALLSWDGGWYLRVAQRGYEWQLRLGADGRPKQSTLAFFPVYPGLIRALHAAGLPAGAAAVGISLVAGAAAAAGIVALLRPALGAGPALVASLLWSGQPVSPVLGMAYTEALFCAEVVLFFLLLARRRYGWLALLLPVLGLTRGAVAPLVGVLLVHLVVSRRRPAEGSAQRFWPVALIPLALASALLWPAVVGIGTGRWSEYQTIQRAWSGTTRSALQLWWQAFTPWNWGQLAARTAAVALTMVIVAAIGLWGLRSPLSPELKAYPLAYLVFVVALLPPDTSVFRFLVPLFALQAVLAWRLRAVLAWGGLLAGQVLLQFVWIEAILTSGHVVSP